MTQIPRPEHPRPDQQRDQWVNLNGPWRFAFDPRAIGEQERWHRPIRGRPKNLSIIVPYPWESRLSGVAAPEYKGAAWYEREITVPREWQGLKPFLHFGAVDWNARVWLDGRLVAEHENGYLPFYVDLSPHLKPGESARLDVRAFDIADAATLVGKQVPRWYTCTSGIWQTVWLEARAPSHVSNIRVVPDVAREQARVDATLCIAAAGAFVLRLRSPEDAFPTVEEHLFLADGVQHVSTTLRVPAPRLWSPESPYLYQMRVELEPLGGVPDQLSTYFAMRTVGRGRWDSNDYEYILLNDEPVYLRGALDQAFHPEGIYAYPSDEAIRADVQLAKDLGLNMLRCHIKINEPRYYHWADRLGILVMYDMPSPDLDSPSMRRTWEAALRGAIERDFNHPSIFAWVLFNETWGLDNHDTPEGQAWVREMYHLAKALDPTRLVEDNSPIRHDHVSTDINSWHFYINDYHRTRLHVERVVAETYPGSSFNFVGGEYVQGSQPLMNSEYAGISARMGDLDVSWSFKYQTTELRRHAKVCGYVYTELSDVEWEHNGFVNYDRTRKEFGYDFFVPGMSVRDLNSPDFVGLDAPPCQTLSPGEEFAAPVFVSHFGPPLKNARVLWRLDFIDRFGDRRTVEEGALAVRPQRFGVTPVGILRLRLPDESGLATVALWLEDEDQKLRCRNYVNVEVRAGESPRAERSPCGWALRASPGAFSRCSWPNPTIEPGGGKFAALGSGWVEYETPLPADLDVRRVRRLRLRLEAGARAGLAKVDWPTQALRSDYPQTEERKCPSELRVLVSGVLAGQVQLPDDPADARGALSHHRGYDPGSYGYLVDLALQGTALEQARQQLLEGQPLRLRLAVPAEAKHRGGLAIYGETHGCYPVDLVVLLDTE